MTDRYYNRTTIPGTELFTDPLVPVALLYNPINVNHVLLDDGNVFWSPIPAGQQLTYDGNNIPDGLEAVAPPTIAQQAVIDLTIAGVTRILVTLALYASARGIPGPLAAIDAAVDLVVISSALTLAEVSELIP